jgi:hypothetical protein
VLEECLALGPNGVRGIVANHRAYCKRTPGLCLEKAKTDSIENRFLPIGHLREERKKDAVYLPDLSQALVLTGQPRGLQERDDTKR